MGSFHAERAAQCGSGAAFPGQRGQDMGKIGEHIARAGPIFVQCDCRVISTHPEALQRIHNLNLPSVPFRIPSSKLVLVQKTAGDCPSDPSARRGVRLPFVRLRVFVVNGAHRGNRARVRPSAGAP